MKKNIAIITWGKPEISPISVESAEQIRSTIDKDKYNINLILIDDKKWILDSPYHQNVKFNKEDFSYSVNNFSRARFDCVIIMMHGSPGEDGKIAAYIDLMGIPYTTSGVIASALSYNKYHCNRFLKGQGLMVAESTLIRHDEKFRSIKLVEKFGLPFYLKSNTGVKGTDVYTVNNIEDFSKLFEKMRAAHGDVLVEKIIEGKEYSCSMIKSTIREIILPISQSEEQLRKPGEPIIDHLRAAKHKTPADIPEHTEHEIKKLSAFVYESLGCSGLVKIDFMTSNSNIFVTDVHTMPEMNESSVIWQQVKAFGMTGAELLEVLIEDAIALKSEINS